MRSPIVKFERQAIAFLLNKSHTIWYALASAYQTALSLNPVNCSDKVDKGDKQHKDFKEFKHFKIPNAVSKYLF